MELQFKSAPLEVRLALEDTIAKRRGDMDLRSGLLQENDLDLEHYTLDADGITDSFSLRRLKLSGWILVVRSAETDAFQSGYSLAYFGKQDGRFRFTHILHGWVPAAILAGIAAARIGMWRKRNSFAPAILHVAGVRQILLWFRGSVERQDFLVPINHQMATESPFPEVKSVKPKLFITRVLRLRKRAAAFNNAPKLLGERPPLHDLGQ